MSIGLDYSKGLIQRMEAFERFYALHPEWQNKVTYLQIAPKSRSEIPEYSLTSSRPWVRPQAALTESMASRRTPIRYLNRAYSRSSLAGLYRSARVGLVTPLRDGMNARRKKIRRRPRCGRSRSLPILSRFAGAAVECDDALLVNPYDPELVASAIARALEMPLEERRERHQATFRALSRNPVGCVWNKKFIQSLEPTLTVGTPPLVTEDLASIRR